MLKQIRHKIGLKIKNFIDADNPFSSLSILPFSKYKKNHSKQDYLNAYEISLYVNRALNIRAKKVGQIKFTLKQGEKEIENDPIMGLLSKPSPAFTGVEFWALWQKYKDIYGEAYILTDAELQVGGKTKVTSMHLLRPDRVHPNFNEETGELISVNHKTDKGDHSIDGGKIIYSHNPDPANPLRGESLLRSGIRQIETLTQIEEYQSKILENGGRVEGVFKFKTGSLSKEQLTALKEGFQEEYGMASKVGLPLFLAGDASYEKLAMSPQELAYLETKKLTIDDIVILTGVPHSLLGLTSGQTFSNAEASITIFLNEEIEPMQNALANSLNEYFVPENQELGHVDVTPENKEEKRKDAENGIKNYYLTPNEAREMMGLSPIANGNDIMIPFNLTALGKEVLIETAPTKIKKNIKKLYHPLRDKDNRIIYHSLQVKRLDRRQKLVVGAMLEYFRGQSTRLIEKLQGEKQFKKKGLLADIFQGSLEINIAKETILPILSILLEESAKDSKEIAGSDWEYYETPAIAGWLDKKVSVFSKQINDTTFDKLKSEFQESLDSGESRAKLIERIKDVYGNIEKGRAEVIARTEVHGVTQYGTLQGYTQASMPIKIYVWAPGIKGGVRDNHLAMDGEERPLGSVFSNGLMFPGDPDGGAKETINCQCFI